MKKFKKILSIALSALLMAAPCACNTTAGNDDPGNQGGIIGGEGPGNQGEPTTPDNPSKPPQGNSSGYDGERVADTRNLTPQEYTIYNTTGVDDFGRTILSVDGKESEERYVGLFYFLWLGQHTGGAKKIYDISKITNDGTNNDAFQVENEDSPLGPYHHWGESAFGYYDSGDEWVIRKHIEMFVASGIDFLIFDCTNGTTYKDNAKKVFDILLEYQQAGWKVPKIMYYIAYPDSYLSILKEVYNFAYKDSTYESIWFAPEGKPLITMHQNYYDQGEEKFYGLNMKDSTEKAIFERFQFKCRQWPNEPFEADGVPWMEFVDPQPNHNGWMNVSIGQHLTVRFSDTEGTCGRGWNGYKNDHDRWREDLNFQNQWKNVLEEKANYDDVDYVFVTGWNEWIAMKMKSGNTYFTVDTFNAEYSRDIEPSENNGDNAYMLMSQKIREYNYTAAKHYVYPKTTLDVTKDDAAWGDVTAEYVDFTNDCKNRNYKQYLPTSKSFPNYTDKTGRNDIETIKVARDDNYLYFRVTVAGQAISAYKAGDQKWMNIWIKTQNGKDSYNGYNYVLNRSVNGNKTTIQKASEGALVDCGTGDLYVNGNVMVVRVALSDLDLSAVNYDIEFKVTDNVKEADVFNYLDYYRTGDCAPIGRLNYKYGY